MASLPPQIAPPLAPAAPPAPPATPGTPAPWTPGLAAWMGTGVWHDGELLVVAQGAALPTHMCAKCGGVAGGSPLRKTLSWHEPALALIALASPLIYVIVALVVRKTIKIAFGLCPACRTRHRNKVNLGLAFVGAFVLLVAFDIAFAHLGFLALAGVVLLLVGIIVLVVARLVTPSHIDLRVAKIKGFAPAFRALFPPAAPPPGWYWPPRPPGAPPPGQQDVYEQRLDDELRRMR